MRETVCLLTKQECDNDIGQQQQQQLGMFYYTPSQAYSFLAPLLVNQPYEFPRSWGATNSDPPGEPIGKMIYHLVMTIIAMV